MTPVEAVRARLLAITPVTALVNTRIYPLKLPQSPTLPAIRVSLVGVIEFLHFRGTDRMWRAHVQVDAVAKETSGVNAYAQAQAVAAAVHGRFVGGVATGLCGWTGSVGSPACKVAAMIPDGRMEGYDPEELQHVRVSQDYVVWLKP